MTQAGHRLALPEGYQLHWYTLQAVLGQGGFGITYRAQDNNLKKLVAIKEFLPSECADRLADSSLQPHVGEDGDYFAWGLARFLVEAQTLARFRHRSIISVMSVFEQNNTAYMVMEYEHGDDLAYLLGRQKTLPEEELTRIFLPIIEGLHQVHESGFIHRDIKPSNIYIRHDQSSVLLDFGSARQAIRGKTQELTRLGTFGYAPVEQYNEGFGRQGPWTDIYALAATMYRAVSGERPAEALARSAALLGDEPDPVVALTPQTASGYSPNLLAAINRGLQLKPADRPQSAMEWESLIRGDGPVGKPILANAEAPTCSLASSQPRQQTGSATSPEHRSHSASTKPIVAALGIAVAIGSVAYYFLQLHSVEAPDANQHNQDTLSQEAPLVGAPATATLDGHLSPPGVSRDLPALEPLAIPKGVTVKSPYERTDRLENALHQAAAVNQQILEIAPDDLRALAASSTLASKYVALVNTAWFRADQLRAISLLDRGLAFFPSSETLQQLYSDIQTGPETTNDQAIAALIGVANNHLRAGRFTRPEGANAVAAYQQVLRLRPDNELANRQLRLIADIFAQVAKRKLAATQFIEAARAIEQGLVIYPQHAGLTALRRPFTERKQ